MGIVLYGFRVLNRWNRIRELNPWNLWNRWNNWNPWSERGKYRREHDDENSEVPDQMPCRRRRAAKERRERGGGEQDGGRSSEQVEIHHRPSFRARSISADSRSSSSGDKDPVSTSAAAACAADPSKNVLTMRDSAELRARSRGTDGP